VVLVEEKSKLYMDSQPQKGAFNMDPCTPCKGKWISHIETGKEKHCKGGMGFVSFADM
jgi:hypothetical protein